MRAIAALVVAITTVFLLGTGTARADCQTQCYDSGNTREHCVTTCN